MLGSQLITVSEEVVEPVVYEMESEEVSHQVQACVVEEAFHRGPAGCEGSGLAPPAECQQEWGVSTISTVAAGSASVSTVAVSGLVTESDQAGPTSQQGVQGSFLWHFRRANPFPSGIDIVFMTEALRTWSSYHTPLCFLDRIFKYSFGVGQDLTAGTFYWLGLRAWG